MLEPPQVHKELQHNLDPEQFCRKGHHGVEFREVYKNSYEGRRILKQIYGLRAEVYAVLGWILHSGAKLINDEFDGVPYSTHYALIENGQVIGAHRMTKYSDSFKLPFLKEGSDPDLFGVPNERVSEANRLLIKQDRKYPGCAKQLLFNTTNYELENHSQAVVSIGFSYHLGFFEFMGYRAVSKELECVLDRSGDKTITRKGTPVVATPYTLNRNLDLDKYNLKREFVVIKNG
ncbi:hypothetical protein KY347_04375 [Candidatus Woesearchaeota archaeon]|nr:hypothetical protein [Candidatus Woesearchaeota archaeon]